MGPVPESVFNVPVPDPELDKIDIDTIKNKALEMDVKVPDWAQDQSSW